MPIWGTNKLNIKEKYKFNNLILSGKLKHFEFTNIFRFLKERLGVILKIGYYKKNTTRILLSGVYCFIKQVKVLY